MTKHTLEILRYSHHKVFKVCLAIFRHIHKRVNETLHISPENAMCEFLAVDPKNILV